MAVVATLACLLLAALAAVHFYWALGGAAGKAGSIPSSGGRPLFEPGPGMTALVGAALLAMAALVAAAASLIPAPGPAWLVKAATGALALVFLARAVGDFRHVGFFKRMKHGVFARRDTCLYSPLCLALAALIGAVALA
jgi:hypothetical protein